MELPSLIIMFVEDGKGPVTELLRVVWDAAPVFEWLADNSGSISHEAMPHVLANQGKSIAQRARVALDLVDPFDEVTVDTIFSYLRRHSLTCAFSGTSVPDIVVGLGPEGGEISCHEPGATWRYNVDLLDFSAAIRRVASELSGRRSRLEREHT
jgi:hypothetical protein